MAETGYAGTSYAARRKPNGGLGKYYREADPSQGDPTTMLVKCGKCKDDLSVRIDDNPCFSMLDGTYVRPGRRWCSICPEQKPGQKPETI
ncbi:hypothetical protein VD0002_g6013 [Verticillium dahliae]|nr:hypothetical protein BJF96_g3348 [Verticillium dahliae]PNH37621.1 hypothetical protein VD0004_g9169 [Verticillium dahliae]PNH38163.1 hypothetical protein VD0003_g10261 [Verticillium dahliae]PNH59331.1 hypothetical protein VD0001_g9929 [Verticillium dahliae]PNH61895.1 hypothetical protein VD0002_g6013 [Verticillium dahliae]